MRQVFQEIERISPQLGTFNSSWQNHAARMCKETRMVSACLEGARGPPGYGLLISQEL